jgi:SAM-dependent methyltransferase
VDPYATVRDSCLSVFGAVYDAAPLPWPPGATILEVGCAEADWMTPILAVRPDLHLTGIDWRPVAGRPGSVLQGDVLTVDWPAETFDAMVGISSIEHIGLWHYDHDPLDAEGDRHCMDRVWRWLKPGGVVYLDVPYDPAGYHVEGTSHRVYDDRALATRLVSRFVPVDTWYVAFTDIHRLIPKPTAIDGMTVVACVARKAG